MDKSKSIAKIVGPTLTVMVLSEMRFWNPTLYDTQVVPVIYLNGILLFVLFIFGNILNIKKQLLGN